MDNMTKHSAGPAAPAASVTCSAARGRLLELIEEQLL
jgi:hypothetical protein